MAALLGPPGPGMPKASTLLRQMADLAASAEQTMEQAALQQVGCGAAQRSAAQRSAPGSVWKKHDPRWGAGCERKHASEQARRGGRAGRGGAGFAAAACWVCARAGALVGGLLRAPTRPRPPATHSSALCACRLRARGRGR